MGGGGFFLDKNILYQAVKFGFGVFKSVTEHAGMFSLIYIYLKNWLLLQFFFFLHSIQSITMTSCLVGDLLAHSSL